jgi:rhodanese-related sulfurtransferase
MKEDLLTGKGMVIGGIRHMSPNETFEVLKLGAILVDVRPPLQVMMKAFDAEGIIYCSYLEFKSNFSCIPKDRPVVLGDAVGLRSMECVKILLEKGYSQVASMTGGIVDWEHDGLPLLKNPGSQLNGPCMCQLRPPNKKE